MLRYFERLRARPLAERRQAAAAISILAIIIIAAAWLIFTFMRFSPLLEEEGAGQETPRIPNTDNSIRGPYE
ncbi:MAG: hypothetical protein ACE5F4_01300 [Candidatus Paceibacteria bacterium]